MDVQTKKSAAIFDPQFGPQQLPGPLAVPVGITGMVIFAHGNGSSRFGPRNLLVARHLQANGLARFLFNTKGGRIARSPQRI